MTWKEFKTKVEEAGVKDDTIIEEIDFVGLGAQFVQVFSDENLNSASIEVF